MELATFFCPITQTSTLLTQTWTQISTIQTIKWSGTSLHQPHEFMCKPHTQAMSVLTCSLWFAFKDSLSKVAMVTFLFLATELSVSTYLFLCQTEVIRLLVQTLFRLRQPLCIQDYVRLCCSIITRLQRCFDPAFTELLCLFLEMLSDLRLNNTEIHKRRRRRKHTDVKLSALKYSTH